MNCNNINGDRFNFVGDYFSHKLKDKNEQSPLLKGIGVLKENKGDKTWTVVVDYTPTRDDLYKTEACKFYHERGVCVRVKCNFYHSEDERRPKPIQSKYKTKPCDTYEETGSCKYGERCRFIHAESFSFGEDPSLE